MNLKDKKFYKILPVDMVCRGFKYREGLNVDDKPFNDKECSNGLHFSDSNHIFDFCNYGSLIADVEIPDDEEVLCFEEKYKAHSIILKNIKPLWLVSTLKYLVENGMNIHVNNDVIFRWALVKGHLDVVKYLVENGVNIHAWDDCALQHATENGHLDIVKYLVEHGANVHARNDYALRYASEKGHLDIVRYLIENGANIHTWDDYALRLASKKGHLDVVKYLIENGASIHEDDDYALRWASENGHLDVVEYLESLL